MGQSKCLAAALSYLRKGWSVVPLNAASKIPAVKWLQYQTERPTSEQVRSWFTTMPDASIGIITGAISGLVAADLDGEIGLRSAQRLGLSSSVVAKSRRGAHLYYRHPGHAVKTQAGQIAPGIDIRGDGGLVVAPPSKRSDGLEYYWMLNGALPPLPACLSKRVIEVGRNSADWIAEKVAGLAPGNRHDTFVSLVGRCHRDGWSADDIRAVLGPMAGAADFDGDELDQIIESLIVKPRPAVAQVVTGADLLATQDPAWLIKGAVPHGCLALVSGVPGSGKSLILLDTAIELASQKPETIFGQGTPANRVLYIDAENGQGLVARRVRDLLAGKQRELPSCMHFVFDGFRLDTPDGLAKLEGQLATIKPSVLFLDSLIQFHSQSENDSVEMTAVMNSLRMLKDKYGLTIFVLHHESKMAYQFSRDNVVPTAGDCRGSIAIPASCETMFSVRQKAGGIQLHHTKSRCGEALKPMQIVLDTTIGLRLRAGMEEENDNE